MELVINVPDDFYERMIEENGMSYIDAEVVVDAFYKAVPLPKRLSSFGTRTLLEADKEVDDA